MRDHSTEFERPRYLYAAPLYRRLVLIIMAGLIGVPAAALVGNWFFLGQPIPWNFGATAAIAAGCVFLASLLRARIRIDRNGIARRTLFAWRVTPWNEITRRPAETVCVGEGPWTRAPRPIQKLYRKLTWLTEADAVLLYRLLTPPGTAMHLPGLPEKYRAQVFGLKWLQIDTEGLRLENDGDVQSWFWNDVQQIKAAKERSSDPGFERIGIVLGNGRRLPLTPSTVQCESGCRCRPDFLLVQFLRQVLPADKLLVFASSGPPMSVADAAYRHALTQSSLRTGRKLALGFGAALIALLGWGVLGANDFALHIAIVLIAHSIIFGPIAWKLMADERAKREMLEEYLAARGSPAVRD